MNDFLIVNGEITENIKLVLDDRGFTLGDGLFETIPLYDGKPFLLDEHLARLEHGAGKLWFSVPFKMESIPSAITSLAKRNKIKRGVARLTLTRGAGGRGYALRGCENPTWVLTVRPYSADSDKQAHGIVVAQVAEIRKDPQSPLAGIKSTSAMDKVYAMETARRNGADEALLISTDGYVASLASANIFWVNDSILYTPSMGCGILAGVTRGATLKLAKENGIQATEGRYKPDVLKKADEVFATNSLIEIQPIREIFGLLAKTAPGSVTQQLRKLYRKLTGV